jgi:fibro-slime domain-containing protein
MFTPRHLLSFAVISLFIAASTMRAARVELEGTIRDFHGSFTSAPPFTPEANGHPAFEIVTLGDDSQSPSRIPAGYGGLQGVLDQIKAPELGIVADTLGADRKPVWVGGSNPALFPTTKLKINAAGDNLELNTDDAQNAANFNQWFNDTPNINQSKPFTITLDDSGNNGHFKFADTTFFPIDDELFGNEGRAHNYHFTFEAHTDLVARAGQTFSFMGDDDVWVFINNKLAIDLGGAHKELTGTVNVDDLGLTPGTTYPIDFFFAERNTFNSQFVVDTTIPLGPRPPEPIGAPLPPGVYPGMGVLAGLGIVGVARQLRHGRTQPKR